MSDIKSQMDPLSYSHAGVNKEEGYIAVDKYKHLAKKTYNQQVLSGIGGFASLFQLQPFDGPRFENPILVSGTDGVGTKLELAKQLNRWGTIGIDCVAMCVNDVLCQGAKPLFFLDYLACGQLNAETAAQIVSGIAYGCELSNMSLIGGETAEMPGFYQKGQYDMAGFCVGVVDKKDLIDGEKIQPNDLLIGLKSSGFHSNGYSLLRKIFTDPQEVIDGQNVYDVLMKPTKIYVQDIMKVLKYIKGMAHITGGGWIENIPRMLPSHLKKSSAPLVMQLKKPELKNEFLWAHKKGISYQEMISTFNCGIGFVLAIREADLLNVQNLLPDSEVIGCIRQNTHSEKSVICFE